MWIDSITSSLPHYNLSSLYQAVTNNKSISRNKGNSNREVDKRTLMVCENNHYSTTHYSSLDGVQHNIIELTDLDIIFTLKPIENYKRVKNLNTFIF